MTQTDSIKKLKDLVEQFGRNIDQYKSTKYNETNARIDFIDKFFALLGWDMANDKGLPESLREVVREDNVKVGKSTKKPDYTFRKGKKDIFYVEAKKPSVNIKDATEPAFQVRQYAWSAKFSLSILTDFEEFSIYDTRNRARINDKASVGRIFYCTYEEYEKQFDFIYGNL